MHWMAHPYTISLVAASVISLALAGSAWKTATTIHTRSFTILMLAVSLWSTMHIFELAAFSLPGKVFWANMQFFCIVSVPPALLGVVIRYTRRDHLITPFRVALILSVPLLIAALVWTNDFHGWVFTGAEIVHVPPFDLLYRHFGPGFWIHTGYCYLIMMVGTFLLVRSMITTPSRYKGQVISLLVGISVPWIGNVMYIFRMPLFSDFDMTPVVFTISGIAFGWGVFRHRLLDVVPIAYDVMLNNMQDAVFVFDRHQRVLDLNPAAVRLTGQNRKNILSLTADRLIPGWSDRVEAIGKGGQRQQVCLRNGQQDRYFDLVGTPLKRANYLFGYLVVLRDISEYRNTQLALADSERQFKSLSENAPIVICTLDPQGVFTYVNPEWENVLGHPREYVTGRHYSEFVLPYHLENYAGAFRKVRDDRKVLSGFPIKLLHSDGSRRFFSISASPNLDTQGEIYNIICLLKDLTGERELQDQLFQSQKMEAIGTLAGGVAHDFNNLLMGIQANISLVRMETDQGKPCAERLDRIECQIQTGASLTHQLLGYARKGKYRPTLLCLNQLIRETLSAFGRTRKQLTLDFDLLEDLPRVHADRGQMELVLLNLLVNASDAMPDGGVLTVKTDLHTVSPVIKPTMDLSEGDYVHLQISDTGTGMDEKTLERIFEPFFTTKEMGRGTGLGLASVYGVVKNHQGAITVSSQPGEGTTFHLYFQAALDACPAPGYPRRLHTGKGRILLVDDELELLQAGVALLEGLGYSVTAIDNGSEALDHLSSNPNSFDLVILDMIMPGMGGRELYGHIRRLFSDTPILLSTGFSDAAGTTEILSHRRSDIICKPYTAEALSQKISKMMLAPGNQSVSSTSKAS
ncbi:MAG: PAS domain S-box protein [Deltaproteobacteria bacterium]|nr:PAS domain S-box protein [Deltaproteobacteria bacterium]